MLSLLFLSQHDESTLESFVAVSVLSVEKPIGVIKVKGKLTLLGVFKPVRLVKNFTIWTVSRKYLDVPVFVCVVSLQKLDK